MIKCRTLKMLKNLVDSFSRVAKRLVSVGNLGRVSSRYGHVADVSKTFPAELLFTWTIRSCIWITGRVIYCC